MQVRIYNVYNVSVTCDPPFQKSFKKIARPKQFFHLRSPLVKNYVCVNKPNLHFVRTKLDVPLRGRVSRCFLYVRVIVVAAAAVVVAVVVAAVDRVAVALLPVAIVFRRQRRQRRHRCRRRRLSPEPSR